jgi:DtxR family Mn-dependent transcriptional regulator
MAKSEHVPSNAGKPPPRTDGSKVLTHAMEDYIKAIYKVEQAGERVTTLRLADVLGLSGASVTNMLKRLDELGVVQYVPYRGAALTEGGRRVALEVIRHHRLIELYLTQHMGYRWDEVDAEAEALEHVISEDFEARMDALLGHPDTDPHGHPIPSREGHVRDTHAYVPLSGGQPGQEVIVRRVNDSDAAVLRRLGELGLYPSARLGIVSNDSPDGQVEVRVGRDVRLVGGELASHVFVEVLQPGTRSPA